MAFLFIVLIILPFLNPPTQQKDGDTLPPGNIIVHIVWPSGNTDVDLWVFGPNEMKPVGYSNKGGIVWNLLRDDLGGMDFTDLNYENSYSRGILAGEYIINVHCFRCPSLPIAVKIEVSIMKDTLNEKSGLRIIAETELELRHQGEELTALRFRLDKDGNLLKDKR